MSINWTDFTPMLSSLGGILIGFAALILMLAKGRIMGMSGILSGLLIPNSSTEFLWRSVFVAGVIAGPAILINFDLINIASTPVASGLLLYVAAFCVGIGTAIGRGCTSGHGICGLSRLSARSLCAVLTFVISGIITVSILRHVL
ncbi:MAG: YeeE/YedE family protein [Rhodospirillales bacterium]|nr:YeeE/YedE family protein [Rhodospirillales bacterium]MDC0990116.1 YeeE/YedE family protein [Rhodospirillales bacterium]